MVIFELPSPLTKIDGREEEPETMAAAELKVRDMTIPRQTNVTYCIQKPEDGGRFELKQIMV